MVFLSQPDRNLLSRISKFEVSLILDAYSVFVQWKYSEYKGGLVSVGPSAYSKAYI